MNINSLEMSLIVISEYNQTNQTYGLVICVYNLLCVNCIVIQKLIEIIKK